MDQYQQTVLNELAFFFNHTIIYQTFHHVAPSFELSESFNDSIHLVDQLLNTFTDTSLKQHIAQFTSVITPKQVSMFLEDCDEWAAFKNMIQNRPFILQDIKDKWPGIIRFVFSETFKNGQSPMQTIKIFLASSNELEHERDQIELMIARTNEKLESQAVRLKLIRWERLLHVFRGERIQDYFTQQMLACDIVLILFKKKVGQFTREEFDLAYDHLKEFQRPRLLVFFWDGDIQTKEFAQYMAVFQLKSDIEDYEQIYQTFTSPEDLTLKINDQLDLMIPEIKKECPQVLKSPVKTVPLSVNHEKLKASYLHRVLKEVGILNLAGIDRNTSNEKEQQLNLSAIYTALLTHNMDHESMQSKQTRTKQLSALNLLNKHHHLVLMGAPGSGKTTFVNFVTMCLAGELLHHPQANLELLTRPLPVDENDKKKPQPQVWKHKTLLPLRIILRDFVARGLPDSHIQGTASHLWNFIQTELDRFHLSDYGPLFKQELQENGGLVMFDGLDEVPEADTRRTQIKQVIEDFMVAFHRCRILVTARTYAYQHQNFKINGLTEATLAPFSPPQIDVFVERWYAHIAEIRNMHPDNAQKRAVLLKQAIKNSKQLRELAERPLLLTLMGSLHAWRGGSLPEQRERLYAEAVELLLDWWERPRLITDDSGNTVDWQPGLMEWLKVEPRDTIRHLLDQLAFEAHQNQPDLKETADILKKDLVQGLMDITSEDVNPKLLVSYLRDRAGILVERGVGVYTFPHRTFQEYLAACYLTDTNFPEKVSQLASNDLNRWREVTLLAAAKAGRGSESSVWLLAEELCHSDVCKPVDRVSIHGAYLAAQVLLENANLKKILPRNEEKLKRIKNWLIYIIRGNDLPAIERSEAGNLLATLDDPRKEVMTVEQIKFCYVPEGPFLMGSDPEIDKNMYKNEAPRHSVILSSYYISLYPVTQAQYQCFVDDQGYDQSAFWKEAIDDGLWKNGNFQNRKRAKSYGGNFDLPNHPVVGITWYEARAFTRWLTVKYQELNLLPADKDIRLPTEAEWEKASRGGSEQPGQPHIVHATDICSDKPEIKMKAGENRIYPWGKTVDEDKMNCEMIIQSTSAVGCFCHGQSIYGCEEMSGNVWEWCNDWYEGYPSTTVTDPVGPIAGSDRVIRGGSWDNYARYCRSAYRFSYRPENRNNYLGFRLCAPGR